MLSKLKGSEICIVQKNGTKIFNFPNYCEKTFYGVLDKGFNSLNETTMTLRAGTFFIRPRMIHNFDRNF